MESVNEFFGKPFSYWIELEQSVGRTESQLIGEVATLRAKISYYEAKINELANFMRVKLEVKLG